MPLSRWSISFSSSSPSSSSSSSSSSNNHHRRLTRAKQLRYLRDCDIQPLDFSLNSSPPHRHRHRDVDRSSRSSSPSPLPLPVPESSPLLTAVDDKRHKSKSISKSKRVSHATFRLPSPTRVSDEGKTSYYIEPNTSRVSPQEVRRKVDAPRKANPQQGIDNRMQADSQQHCRSLETWSPWSVPKRTEGSHRTQQNLSVDINYRSAPTSTSSSPMRSPQRMLSGDPFFYPMEPSRWSEPALSTGFQYAGLPESDRTSCDASPLRSPLLKSPRPPRNSTSGPPSPLHPKLSVEISSPHYDNSFLVNGHPLPRPPTPSSSVSASPAPQLSATPEFLPLKSQWTKGKLIGRGTFGSVFVATNRETGALCAMKEVHLCPDDSNSVQCMKQLEQEIKVLSDLKHPNIVQYFGSEIADDMFYIYLEYVYPGSVNKYIREHCGAITEAVVRNFTRHILSGLAYLHARKTIHRDIKGANLLVDASGVVKLADFGMAKHLTGQADVLSLKGSPYWMAPELMQAVMQKDNSSDLAFVADIWSLGCTIIEMLTGKPPWSELEGAAAMFKVLKESPPIPETLSTEGKDFLRCCFQRDPADRPPASKLLEHPFVRTSQQLDFSPSRLVPDFMNQTDKVAHSPLERHDPKLEKIPLSPIRRTTNGSNYIN